MRHKEKGLLAGCHPSMKTSLTLAQKAIILVSIPLFFEIAFVCTLGLLLSQAEYERAQEAHAKDVAYKCNSLLFMVIQLGTTSMINEYSKRSTGQSFMPDTNHLSNKAIQDFEDLKELTRGHPEEEKQIRNIEKLHAEVRLRLKRFRKETDSDTFDPAEVIRELVPMREQVSRLTGAIQEMMAEQKKIQIAKRDAQAKARAWVTLDLLIGMVFNIFLALSLAFYFNRGTASRLEILMDNTRRLARGQELNPPISGDDEIAHLDTVFNEMAKALAEAARKERAVIANAMDVICSLDQEGKFTAVNPAAEKVWGFKCDQLLGSTWRELVVSEDRERTEKAIERIIAGEINVPIENRVRRADGKTVDILWSVHWSEAEQSLFCVAHDITERKEIERMKRDFVAMVSHDLRTPLTSVQSFLSLLETGMYGELNEGGQENRSYADSSVARLINLINDLLDIEKMESGKFELNCADVSVDEILNNAAQSTRGYAEQQGVNIVADESRLALCADGDRLIQVLVNLVSNAVKFSPRGAKVTISAVAHENAIEFRVSDTGRGIPEEYRAAVFERFRQVDKADAKKLRGSGLGLAICKAIVERHGGVIGVDSEEGKGSTFWFRIPCQPGEILTVSQPQAIEELRRS